MDLGASTAPMFSCKAIFHLLMLREKANPSRCFGLIPRRDSRLDSVHPDQTITIRRFYFLLTRFSLAHKDIVPTTSDTDSWPYLLSIYPGDMHPRIPAYPTLWQPLSKKSSSSVHLDLPCDPWATKSLQPLSHNPLKCPPCPGQVHPSPRLNSHPKAFSLSPMRSTTRHA